VSAPASVVDARVRNWTFVVPSVARVLFLPVEQEDHPGAVVPAGRTTAALDVALAAGPFPGVAAPSLAGWRTAAGGDTDRLLAALGAAVAPGGWLYAGFPNAWYPGNAGRNGSLTLGRVLDTIGRAGLHDAVCYLAFPHERLPAYLIEADDPAALRYFLAALSFPYVEGGNRWKARAKQVAMAGARRAALLTPAGLRSRAVPGLAVVARRPS